MRSTSGSEESGNLRRFVVRGALLVLPFLSLQLIELFCLPVDFFTFRVWEAAEADPYQYPGGFYPNFHISKSHEFGDKYRSGIREEKAVEWFTDAYGFRNRPQVEREKKYHFVVLGDSNIAGSFLDQKNTLAEVLMRRTKQRAYSYHMGHESTSYFFSDPRIREKTIDLVVAETRPQNWMDTGSTLTNFRMPRGSAMELNDVSREIQEMYSANRRPQIEMLHSRLTKQPLLNYLKASLAATWTPTPSLKTSDKVSKLEDLSFLSSQFVPNPLNGSDRRALSSIESQYYFYHATLVLNREAKTRGMDFIMFLMPTAINNDSRLIPAIHQLRKEGVKVLAYEPNDSWPIAGVDNDWFWEKADSHWTEAAVRLIADEIIRMKSNQDVSNRPLSNQLMTEYSQGFPESSSFKIE